MANETTIDAETARRLLLILSLEGDVKREWKEWALRIIHQIPGYSGITMEKAVKDDFLREVLVAIAAEQLSSTTPKDLEALIEDAQKREASLKSAKETGEKRAEEFIEAAEKAAKTKAPTPEPETTAPSPPPEETVSFGVKITPAALKAFSESAGKAAGTPFKLVSFFSPPGASAQTPQTTAALASAMSLSQISAKASGLPEVERKQLLRFVENLRQAEFSFYAQVKLQRTPLSVRGMTILMGSEFGMTQGEVVTLVHGGAPSGKGPSLIGRVGQQIFGGLAQRAVTSAATRVVTSALTKAGVSITTTAAGTAIAPGVGTLVGLAVGWLVDKGKDLLSWITRNAPKVAIGIGAFLFGTGFILQSNILMVGGVGVGFGGFIGKSGGFGPALSKAGGFASSVIGGITSLTVASIATPLIVALISIPVLVAIILFIINSGAYLVPPKGEILLGFLESPYIKVEKTATPPGPFQNSQLPLNNITYKISVSALKGSLTNVRFDYSCSVYKKGSKPPCPSVSIKDAQGREVALGKQEGLIISPTSPYVLTYTASYDTSFSDSAVIDTFVVTADTTEQAGAVSSGSASIIIGKPPLGCFVFNNNVGPYFKIYSLGWEKYPARMQKVIGAITTLSLSSSWLDSVCRGGEVVLTHARQEGGWGAWAPSATAKDIIFYSTYGITEGSSNNYALYLFAHESGHLIDYRNSFAGSQYRELAAHEGFLPTYPACCRSAGEDLAESIGRYPIHHPILEEPRFQGHKEFAKFIFGIDF